MYPKLRICDENTQQKISSKRWRYLLAMNRWLLLERVQILNVEVATDLAYAY